MARSSTMLSRDEVERREFRNAFGETRLIYDFYKESPGPQGFMVGMPANNVVNSHFHRVDQFQVFFETAGASYQRSPIDSLLIHYADAYTVYGPFETAETPMEFFTLRARSDEFVGYMPQDRDQLIRRGRRNIHASVALAADPGALPVSEVTTKSVIERQDDGLSAELLSVGPLGNILTPDPAGSAGQYACVVNGTARSDEGRQHAVKSLQWVSHNAEPLRLRAGNGGVEVLIMQFPAVVEAGGDAT